MDSSRIYLPPQTILDFITSVRKALQDHPDPSSDATLKEMKHLAEEIEADARRHQRKLQEEARREARARQRKLEAAQRRQSALANSRKPGDFSSVGLIGFGDSTKR